MTIPALWLDIGIHVAVKAKEPVASVTAQAGIETFLELAPVWCQMNAVALPDR